MALYHGVVAMFLKFSEQQEVTFDRQAWPACSCIWRCCLRWCHCCLCCCGLWAHQRWGTHGVSAHRDKPTSLLRCARNAKLDWHATMHPMLVQGHRTAQGAGACQGRAAAGHCAGVCCRAVCLAGGSLLGTGCAHLALARFASRAGGHVAMLNIQTAHQCVPTRPPAAPPLILPNRAGGSPSGAPPPCTPSK